MREGERAEGEGKCLNPVRRRAKLREDGGMIAKGVARDGLTEGNGKDRVL